MCHPQKLEPRAGSRNKSRSVTLKTVADAVQLSPSTVSVVLNRTPVAKSIPSETQERIFEAARRLRYQPNHMARSLRRQRSFTVGVVLPELGDDYSVGVMEGLEAHLLDNRYLCLITSERSRSRLGQGSLERLLDRSVEGLILIATPLSEKPTLPTVAVAGHQDVEGVTNIVIDHRLAARQALGHLKELGHSRIAFLKGPEDDAEAMDRWRAIEEVAVDLGLEVRPELVEQITSDPGSKPDRYREGFDLGRVLLARLRDFTALFAYNDMSAIGALRAFSEAGLTVPRDVSVIGFDDIRGAEFSHPSLTTIQQPLRRMGTIAGQALLARLGNDSAPAEALTVAPELVVRDSTAPMRLRRVL